MGRGVEGGEVAVEEDGVEDAWKMYLLEVVGFGDDRIIYIPFTTSRTLDLSAHTSRWYSGALRSMMTLRWYLERGDVCIIVLCC